MSIIARNVPVVVVALSLWGCVVYRAEPTAGSVEAERDREREHEHESAAAGSDRSAVQGPAAPAPPPQGPPRTGGEVCAVREAIVAALRASAEPWAQGLVDVTAGAPCALEPDGTARIGSWSLRACVEGCESLSSMRFVWREPGAQTPSYAAEVVREGEGGFRCAMLGRYLVQPAAR
jgi:hypothetical protein